MPTQRCRFRPGVFVNHAVDRAKLAIEAPPVTYLAAALQKLARTIEENGLACEGHDFAALLRFRAVDPGLADAGDWVLLAFADNRRADLVADAGNAGDFLERVRALFLR